MKKNWTNYPIGFSIWKSQKKSKFPKVFKTISYLILSHIPCPNHFLNPRSLLSLFLSISLCEFCVVSIMGRAPCCDKANVKKGPWSPDEDNTLRNYIHQHGTGGNWIVLPRKAGSSSSSSYTSVGGLTSMVIFVASKSYT